MLAAVLFPFSFPDEAQPALNSTVMAQVAIPTQVGSDAIVFFLFIFECYGRWLAWPLMLSNGKERAHLNLSLNATSSSSFW